MDFAVKHSLVSNVVSLTKGVTYGLLTLPLLLANKYHIAIINEYVPNMNKFTVCFQPKLSPQGKKRIDLSSINFSINQSENILRRT